jgi:PEP-CTERM motif
MKNTTLITAALATLVGAGSAHAVSITATALADFAVPPITVDATLDLPNGDFLIKANPAAGPGHVTGDGVDETTWWSFDFTADPNYAAFMASGPITSARLSFRLSTQFFIDGVGPWTDIAAPSDGISSPFGGWVLPAFMSGTFGVWQSGSISTDLVQDVGMDGAQLKQFLADFNGAMPMLYADDAVVGFAQLQLSTAPVPEPGTWALMAAGLLGLAQLQRRQRSAN